MRLSSKTLSDLAELICGGSGGNGISRKFFWNRFPYRTGSELTLFFRSCDLPYEHDGSTRKDWVEKVLEEINQGSVKSQQLPSEPIIKVLQELMDAVAYQKLELDRSAALTVLNHVLARDNIEAYFDASERCHIRSTQIGTTSASLKVPERPLSAI